MLKKLLTIAALVLLPLSASAQVFNQSQLIVTPYNGFVYSSSTANGAKLGASSTPFFNAFLFGSATGTSATTTNFFSTTASSTNLFGNFISGFGFVDCVAATSALTYTASTQRVGCHTISSSGGGSSNVATSTQETTTYVPFWTSTNGTPATLSGGSSLFTFASGQGLLTISSLLATYASTTNFLATGSSTLQAFTATQSTTTNATTTTAFATTASSTNLFATNVNVGNVTSGTINGQTINSAASLTGTLTVTSGLTSLSNLLLSGSSTLQNFTGINATVTSATTSSFFSTIASSTSLWAQAAKVGTLTTSGLGTLSSLSVTGSATLNGSLVDSAASAGTGGYVLMSTGSQVQWVATSTLSNATAYKQAAVYATTAALPSNNYTNGVGGVGATIAEIGNGALSIDGAAPSVGQRVLIKNEGTPANNGIYTVTATGSAIATFLLTRATDYNTSLDVFPGVANYVTSGTVNVDSTWVMTSAAPITIGTTDLNYSELGAGGANFTAGSVIYSDGSALSQNNSNLFWRNGLPGLGLGTSTPMWTLNIASSTRAQLTLSDGLAADNHWSFRNAGGLFYLATSSPSTFATSTTAVLSIDANGLLTLTTGLLTNGSSTLQNFTGINSTTTNATTTSFSATTASSTNLFTDKLHTTFNLLVTSSSTLQNFTGLNSTTTNATTTSTVSTTASSTKSYLGIGQCLGSAGKAQTTDANGLEGCSTITSTGITALTMFPLPNFRSVAISSITLSDNTICHVGQIVIPFGMTVNAISVNVTDATNPGREKFALFTEDGQTQKFATTTFVSTTGIKTFALTSGQAITAGVYYIVTVGVDASGPQFQAWTAATTGFDNPTSKPVLEGTLTCTAGTLPTSFTPSSITQAGSQGLVFRLDN